MHGTHSAARASRRPLPPRPRQPPARCSSSRAPEWSWPASTSSSSTWPCPRSPGTWGPRTWASCPGSSTGTPSSTPRCWSSSDASPTVTAATAPFSSAWRSSRRRPAACAASTSVGMLIGFRLIQAAGAALLTPTSLGLVLASYPPERRQGAVRLDGGRWHVRCRWPSRRRPAGRSASWRVGLPDQRAGRDHCPHRRLAPTAATYPVTPANRPPLCGACWPPQASAALTFGLVKGSDWGWGSSAIAGTLAASAALIALFVLHCLRSRTPLIHPSLFRSRSFTRRRWSPSSSPHRSPRCFSRSFCGSRAPGDGRRCDPAFGHRTRTDHGPLHHRSPWPGGSSPATAQLESSRWAAWSSASECRGGRLRSRSNPTTSRGYSAG